MQQDDNVGILFQRIVQTNAIGDEIVCAAYSPIENMLISMLVISTTVSQYASPLASSWIARSSIRASARCGLDRQGMLPHRRFVELDVHHLFGGQSVADLRPYFFGALSRFGLRTGPLS